jgi:hypothetical protein
MVYRRDTLHHSLQMVLVIPLCVREILCQLIEMKVVLRWGLRGLLEVAITLLWVRWSLKHKQRNNWISSIDYTVPRVRGAVIIVRTLNNLAGLHHFHPSTRCLYYYRLGAKPPRQLYCRSAIFVPEYRYRRDDD